MKGLLISLSVLCLALVMAIPCPAQTVVSTQRGVFGRVRNQTVVNGGIGNGVALNRGGFGFGRQQVIVNGGFNSGFGGGQFVVPQGFIIPRQQFILPNGQIIIQ